MGEYSSLVKSLKSKSNKYYHFEREEFPSKGSIIVRPISNKGYLIPILFQATNRNTILTRIKKSHPFKTKNWVTSANLNTDLVCFVEGNEIKKNCIAFEITSVTEKVVFARQILGDKKALMKFYRR
jgi:hypothetical protein